jgi:hypothetical protein
VRSESQLGEYTMSELSELIFPPDMGAVGHLCMVYNCFLDDSKDQKQEQMIISAGFFAVPQVWKPFRQAWNACLRACGIEYFKTSEWRMLNGQFARFKAVDYPLPTGRQAANAIRDELRNILERFSKNINGIGIAIPVADYEEVCAMDEAHAIIFGDPYHHALQSVIIQTLNQMKRFRGRNIAAFVHDDGNDFPELWNVYKVCMNTNPQWKKYSGGFQALDDKLHPELQAADMAANYTLQLGQQWLANGRSPVEKKEFEKSIRWIGIWEKPYILTLLRQQYVHRKLPIPERLRNIAGCET